MLLLLACAHHPTPPSVAAGSAPASFTAHYEGAKMGLGFGCVVDEPPPHGAWTAFLTVADPGDSALEKGAVICVVIHSPSMYRSDFVDESGMLKCLAVPGAQPPRFSCDPRQPPSAEMPVFDEAWARRLDAEYQGEVAPVPAAPATATLGDSLAALNTDTAALQACNPGRSDVFLVVNMVRTMGEQVLAGTDRTGDVETKEMVDAARAQVRAAIGECRK